jgi:hypothetical protein
VLCIAARAVPVTKFPQSLSTITKPWTTWKSHDPADFKIQPWQHGKADGALVSRQPRRLFEFPENFSGEDMARVLNRALEVGFDF